MNFKPNAWTLLFALTFGALIYNMYAGNGAANTEVAVNPIDICPPNSITPAQANDMKVLYENYLDTHKSLFDSLKQGDEGVENPAVLYFSIPRCELRAMVASLNPDEKSNITAHLGIKIDEKTGKNMVDLYFKEKNARPVMSGKGETLASKGEEGETKYWDFTSPCPTLCNE